MVSSESGRSWQEQRLSENFSPLEDTIRSTLIPLLIPLLIGQSSPETASETCVLYPLVWVALA